MIYPGPVWEQIKGVSALRLGRALERDGFILHHSRGSHRVYLHRPSGRRVVFQYHGGSSTFASGTLRSILTSTGWTVDDLIRVGLAKRPHK